MHRQVGRVGIRLRIGCSSSIDSWLCCRADREIADYVRPRNRVGRLAGDRRAGLAVEIGPNVETPPEDNNLKERNILVEQRIGSMSARKCGFAACKQHPRRVLIRARGQTLARDTTAHGLNSFASPEGQWPIVRPLMVFCQAFCDTDFTSSSLAMWGGQLGGRRGTDLILFHLLEGPFDGQVGSCDALPARGAHWHANVGYVGVLACCLIAMAGCGGDSKPSPQAAAPIGTCGRPATSNSAGVRPQQQRRRHREPHRRPRHQQIPRPRRPPLQRSTGGSGKCPSDRCPRVARRRCSRAGKRESCGRHRCCRPATGAAGDPRPVKHDSRSRRPHE